MKITNKTPWRTDHLREIVRYIANEELEPHERKMLHVTISMKPVEISLFDKTTYSDVRQAAHEIKRRYQIVIRPGPRWKPDRLAWEITYQLAIKLPSVGGQRFERIHRRTLGSFAWALEYPLVPKAKKPKSKGEELQQHRYRLILAAEIRWTKKLSAAQRRLATIRKKRKYYEKTLEKTNATNQQRTSAPHEPAGQILPHEQEAP